MVVDEEVPLVECLFEELAFEGRFIGVDHRVHARRRLKCAAYRGLIADPVALAGEGVGWQRDSLSRAVGLKSVPVRKQTFGPQGGNLVRIPALRQQPNKLLFLPSIQ